MEGCREEKTCCEFEQNLVLKQEIYLTFNGRKPIAQCNVFPAKRLGIFFRSTPDT